MRIRSRRKSRPPQGSSPLEAAGDGEIAMIAATSLSPEQLNALGPMTGPDHRTFVPIVRNTTREVSLGELNEVVGPTTAV